MEKQATTPAGRIFHNFFFGGPIPSTLAIGGVGALAGRYAAAPLINMFLPEVTDEEEEERKEKLRNIMTIVGALPGILTGVGWGVQNYRQSGFPGLFKKSSNKYANWLYSRPSVPIQDTRMLIMHDPYLSELDKYQVLQYLDEASGGKDRGLISTEQLVDAGIGAGLGYGMANLAGRTLGSFLGLRPATKHKLSNLGILAGILYGSGIVR